MPRAAYVHLGGASVAHQQPRGRRFGCPPATARVALRSPTRNRAGGASLANKKPRGWRFRCPPVTARVALPLPTSNRTGGASVAHQQPRGRRQRQAPPLSKFRSIESLAGAVAHLPLRGKPRRGATNRSANKKRSRPDEGRPEGCSKEKGQCGGEISGSCKGNGAARTSGDPSFPRRCSGELPTAILSEPAPRAS